MAGLKEKSHPARTPRRPPNDKMLGARHRPGRPHPQVLSRDPEPRTVKLTVVMAAFNEERTIEGTVRNVLGIDFPCEFELIVVDDGSVDATAELLAQFVDPRLRLIHHRTNLGKGTALRTGLRHATGTHIVPFDADGEYLAEDLVRVVEVVLRDGHDVVIGTRAGSPPVAYGSLRYYVGNRVLTRFVRVAFHSNLTDLHSCLKLVPTDLLRSFPLGESGFGADTEIVASLLRRGIEPYEIPISYQGRSRAEGKKIGWWDAVECLVVINRIRIAQPRYLPQAAVILDLTGPEPSQDDGPLPGRP